MVNGKVKQIARKITAGILTAAMCVAFIPKIIGNDVVSAAITKNQSNTCLGTSGLASPVVPKNKDAAWSGSFVYFGKYDSNPIRFRVLAPVTTAFGGTTMFLDSDESLCYKRYDDDSNVWANSEIKSYLNGDFLKSFTSSEQAAIAKSTKKGHALEVGTAAGKVPDWIEIYFSNYIALNGEKIFLLDVEDVCNTNYGYRDFGYPDAGDFYTVNRQKKNVRHTDTPSWWLRSPANGNPNSPGSVYLKGFPSQGYGIQTIGVAPALNVNAKSVIFSTAISGKVGAVNSEYKLTLKDSNLNIAVQSGQKTKLIGEKKISVPYTITGSDAGNANRASVLILDKAYTEGNTNSAKILYYGALSGTFGKTSTGSFTLPSSLDMNGWGSKYHVYIIAEDINGDMETDYASAPVEISAPQYKNIWLQDGNVWRYYNSNGVKVTGWNKIDGAWYLFNSNGDMLKGWQKEGSVWYYLGDNGSMRTGWQKIGSAWYYFGDSGVMRIGWQQIGGVYYFFKSNGSMAANEYCDGYWLDANGAWTYKYKASWKHDAKGWWYGDDSGWYAKNRTLKIDGKNYNFNASGYCTNP
ncbi:MAG: DUF6273 domain-containing protein [Saccharofermentans sp.]|nr:DUF6273 domain-containing protein [Saccharofermentans sp.]